jgi:hypothetical protein
MMRGFKFFLFLLVLLSAAGNSFTQKTLMLEKIGTRRHFYFQQNDPLEIRVKSKDTILQGNLWSLTDSSLTILCARPLNIPLNDIRFVYRKNRHVKQVSVKLAVAGLVYLGIVPFDHIINNQKVITRDVWIVPAAFGAASAFVYSFYCKRYRIGVKWKLKILDSSFHK